MTSNPLARFALTETQGIRRFNDAKLQEAIESAVKRQTKDGLIVVAHADSDNGGSAYLSAAYRFNNEISVVAAAYKEYHKPFRYGAEVVWTPDW
jgi:2-methylcitrate dehydratase PrpD